MARRIYLKMKSLEEARTIFLGHWHLERMLSGETVATVEAAGTDNTYWRRIGGG